MGLVKVRGRNRGGRRKRRSFPSDIGGFDQSTGSPSRKKKIVQQLPWKSKRSFEREHREGANQVRTRLMKMSVAQRLYRQEEGLKERKWQK